MPKFLFGICSRISDLEGTMMIGHLACFKMPVTTLPLKRWYSAPWPWEPRMM